MFTNFEDVVIPNFGYVRLPEIHITDEQKEAVGITKDSDDNFAFLKALCRKGWKEKLPKFNKEKLQKYEDQIKFELDIVKELDFVDYFLLVWMVTNKIRDLGAFVSMGRGSASSSLIFYILGITGVDPIDKDLVFSRFISKVRAKKKVVDGVVYVKGDLAPDVDINIGGVRDDVLKWLSEIYNGKISKISNYSTYTGKILIKDVYKTVENANETDSKEVSDLIGKHAGFVEDIKETYNDNEEFKEWADKHSQTFKIALKLRNLIKSRATHASGYLISYDPLNEQVPLEYIKENDFVVSSYSKDAASNFAIKLDLLGSTVDEIINDVFKSIPEKLEDINLDDDPFIYNRLQDGKLLNYGIFQLSASFANQVNNRVKPKNIYELSDVSALARPGASAFIDDYVNNSSVILRKEFEPVLQPTRGTCLYQEQILRMAIIIGFAPEEAENLRRVIGKKLKDEVKEWEKKIYDKCEQNGFDKDVGKSLWDIANASAKYQFNASHSLSYSYTTALTIYLKYKYPLHFYLSCLKHAGQAQNPIEEIRSIAGELSSFNIKLLGPHLTKSDMSFKIEGNDLRFGLGGIKGISENTISKVKDFCKEYANKFEIFIAAKQAGLGIGHLSALIQAGTLDNYGVSRSKLVLEAQVWNILTAREIPMIITHGPQFHFDLFATIKHVATLKNDRGTLFISASRLETIRGKFKLYKAIYDKNKSNEEFANWFYEKTLLGYSYNTTLHKIFSQHISGLRPIKEILDDVDEIKVRFIGEIEAVAKKTSTNKNDYLDIRIVDEFGNRLKAMLFSRNFDRNLEINNEKELEKGNIVTVEGNKKEGYAIFANSVIIQDWRIYMKLSEVEKEIAVEEDNKEAEI